MHWKHFFPHICASYLQAHAQSALIISGLKGSIFIESLKIEVFFGVLEDFKPIGSVCCCLPWLVLL